MNKLSEKDIQKIITNTVNKGIYEYYSDDNTMILLKKLVKIISIIPNKYQNDLILILENIDKNLVCDVIESTLKLNKGDMFNEN